MRRALLALSFAVVGCGGDDGDDAAVIAPRDYASVYTEVRDCRRSVDHDLQNVRVLAAPDAVTAYMTRAEPFVDGAIVVKEQHALADADCTGAVIELTIMRKLASGTDVALLDWEWQHVSGDRHLIADDAERCARCHATCEEQGVGYAGTCEEP